MCRGWNMRVLATKTRKRMTWRILEYWLLVICEQHARKFICQLVGKRTRPAIETTINNYIKPRTIIKMGKHKAYYWLDKITNSKTYQPYCPALHIHNKCNHSMGFKACNSTDTNEIEGQCNLIKYLCKSMSGLPKSKSQQFLDQLTFEG